MSKIKYELCDKKYAANGKIETHHNNCLNTQIGSKTMHLNPWWY